MPAADTFLQMLELLSTGNCAAWLSHYAKYYMYNLENNMI